MSSTRSVYNDEPALSGDAGIAVFNLEMSFPAILAPFTLLRKIPESQDIDALRALGPVFSHCVNQILHSMTRLPEDIRTSPKYQIALCGVKFSNDIFAGYVGNIPQYDRPTSCKESIHIAMQLLDMAMSGLRLFLSAAAYEVAQLKPLPQLPVQVDVTDEPEVSPTTSNASHVPTATLASSSTDTLAHSPKSKVSTLFQTIKRKVSRRNLSPPSSSPSSTAVDSDPEGLNCGYVHVSVNIRNSLASFPVFIDPSLRKIPHPEDDTELWKDQSGLAQLASLKALVRYMTSPDADNDVEIIDVFFLCFRFFSNPKEMLDVLVDRYHESVPCESRSMAQAHSMQVKVRIAKLVYLWVDLHWRAEDTEVLYSLSRFIHNHLVQDMPKDASARLTKSFRQRAEAGDQSRGLRKEKTVAHAEAKYRKDVFFTAWEPREKRSMMNGDFSRAKLLHFHSSQGQAMVAFQLTLVLWEKYRAFEPEDAVRYLMTRNGEEESPSSEIGRKVVNFMAYEKAVHRFVMDSIGSADSVQMRVELTEFFLELAVKCHELRNYSASCLIALACDRPTVLPFINKLKLSPTHEKMKAALSNFYTRESRHMAGYKRALQSCCCPALPGMMLFIREVARGCGSGPYDQHPSIPGSRLINLKRYRPITWAVRAMEKCHAPFRILRVDYMCDWLEHVLSPYLVGSEVEWENRIYKNCRRL